MYALLLRPLGSLPHQDYCLSLVSWALHSLVVSVSMSIQCPPSTYFEQDVLMIYSAALTFTRETPHCATEPCPELGYGLDALCKRQRNKQKNYMYALAKPHGSRRGLRPGDMHKQETKQSRETI